MKRLLNYAPAPVRSLLTIIVLWMALAPFSVYAVQVPDLVKSKNPVPKLTAETWVLMDFNTGWILAEKNSDKKIEPASLSKLMTAYVVFHEIRKGTLQLDDVAHISEKAWRTEGSRMFVQVNSKVPVKDLLMGLIVQSGNDAAVALAEHVAGSEEGFAGLMNQYARALNLSNTNFSNAPGLPDPDHYSSARDVSLIAAAIIREFPEFYKWYSTKEYTYNNIKQHNRNLLLWRDASVDGVKTGHTSTAGYCLVGSAKRDDMRLIATITGTSSAKQRAKEVHALLKYGFSSYESKRVFGQDSATAQIKVFKGGQDRIPLGSAGPVYVIVPRGQANSLKASLEVPQFAVAPITAGHALGIAKIDYNGSPLMEVPLVALATVPQGTWWQRAIDTVLLWFE
jgi:D-alanyl-D-alanine carboxypeptidase (penicillin-binding protein 5/6)